MRAILPVRIRPALFRASLICLVFLASIQSAVFARDDSAAPQLNSPTQAITVPPGTKMQLVMTRPIWAKTAATGDPIYALTAFPVAINGAMAIPPGTYVQGVIDALTRPTWKSPRAEFQIHFSKLVFANGYVVELLAGAVVSTAYVQISSASDVLLDNGSPLELTLQNPLSVDAKRVADAARISKPPQFRQFKSATRCYPTPGTSGTSDTVIPGTPGSPGTSDIVIPGSLGMPDTVIPGTPATPGTPDTIIPGTPGTAGTSCPAAPLVSNAPFPQSVHKGAFRLTTAASVAGQSLAAGNYQVEWLGPGPNATVDILQNGALIARVQARVVTLSKKAPKAEVNMQSNPNGTQTLVSIQFKGNTLSLSFN
jgi:hypothetical protein